VHSKSFKKDQLDLKGHEKKTLSLSLTVPVELPFKSTNMVPKKDDPSKYFSKHDLVVAQLMASSCKTKHFDIWYEAKISIVYDKLIGVNKDSERFLLNFSQIKQEEAIIRRRSNSFDEIEVPNSDPLS
jgi:hypothetical protein